MIYTRQKFFLISTLLAIGLGLAAFPAKAQDTSVPSSGEEIEATVDALTPYVMPDHGPFRPDEITIKNNEFIAMWATSPHADAQSESFTHWDEDGEINENCATCHSGAGFRDFYGLDETAVGIQGPTPTGGVIDCDTCHSPGLANVTEVALPSGVMHAVSPAETTCMTCHSGRSSGVRIEAAIAEKPVDTVDPELGFINPHYRLAGAIWLGAIAQAGYEFADKTYSSQFFHARPIETCASCHDPHTLQINEDVCSTCHANGEPDAIRLARLSYDGSGDLTQGIRSDLAANAALLLSLIEEYSVEVAGTGIVYEEHYPYFFVDANLDSRADEVDGRAAKYDSWTPRMLRAAFNWKLITADPGAFVHNPHYALEILYDSIEDMWTAMGRDVAELNIKR